MHIEKITYKSLWNNPLGFLTYKQRWCLLYEISSDKNKLLEFIKSECIRKLRYKEMQFILPFIYNLGEEVDQLAIVLILSLYKTNTTSKEIINKLKMENHIKQYYINIYNKYMIKKKALTLLNKLNGVNEEYCEYNFDNRRAKF